jgi:hypothetical protein
MPSGGWNPAHYLWACDQTRWVSYQTATTAASPEAASTTVIIESVMTIPGLTCCSVKVLRRQRLRKDRSNRLVAMGTTLA